MNDINIVVLRRCAHLAEPRFAVPGIYPRRCFIRINVGACHYFSRTCAIIIITFVIYSLSMKWGLLRISISDNQTSVSLVTLRAMHSSPKGFGKIRTDCFRTDNVCKKKKKRKEKKMTRVNSTGFKAFDFDFTPPPPRTSISRAGDVGLYRTIMRICSHYLDNAYITHASKHIGRIHNRYTRTR